MYVKEKDDIAREAFLDWMWTGKPKMGVVFDRMKQTRAVFKLSLRYRKKSPRRNEGRCLCELVDG